MKYQTNFESYSVYIDSFIFVIKINNFIKKCYFLLYKCFVTDIFLVNQPIFLTGIVFLLPVLASILTGSHLV